MPPKKKPAPRKRAPTKTLTAEALQAKHEAVLAKYFGTVEDVDSIELNRYCRLVVKIEQLRKDIDGKETIYQGHGYKPNPMLAVIKEYEYQAAMIANRLGLHLATRQAALGKVKRNERASAKPEDETKDDDLESELASGRSPIPDPV